MALSGPADLPHNLRFVPPSFRSHSRSPSRSPNRKTNFSAQELDPLLNNLSPDSTLSALQTTEAISPTKHEHDILSKSIKDASPDERALGIRAAVAAQKLREWCTELSTWSWPDTEKVGRGKGFEMPEVHNKGERYLGSLTVQTVTTYEDRIEEIKDGLEALDVDELKQHILSAHVSSRSRPSSSNGQIETHPPALTYKQLRDFTAVITATIVQALPFLAKLTTLLVSWDTRLIVLRQVPILLKYLRDTRNLLDGSLKSLESEDFGTSFTREQFLQDREILADSIADLGAKFDRLLDTLEGRDDALPEKWIDGMDRIETDFATWAVEAERRVLYNEWIERNGTNAVPPPELLSPAFTPASRASPSKLSRANSAERHTEVKTADAPVPPQAPSQAQSEDFEKPPSERPNVKVNVLSVHQSIRRLRESAPHAYTGNESPVSAVEPNNHFETGSRLGSEANSEARFDDIANAQTEASDVEKLDGVQEARHKPVANQETEIKEEIPYSHSVPSEVLKKSEDLVQPKGAQDENKNIDSTPPNFLDVYQNDTEPANKSKRPTPLLLPHQFHRRDISNVSAADSVLSDTYTDLSSAEIMDASTAEVVGTPVFDPMPRRASVDLLSIQKPMSDTIHTTTRPQSAHLNDSDLPGSESLFDRKKRALSLSLVTLLPKPSPDEKLRPTSPPRENDQQGEKASDDRADEDGELRRASSTPIETVSSNQIRNIIVSRRGSNATAVDTPFSPSSVYSRDADTLRPTTADSRFSGRTDIKSRASTPSRRSTSISRSSQRGSPEHQPSVSPPERFSPPAIPRRSSRRKSQMPQLALFQSSAQLDSSLRKHDSNTGSESITGLKLDVSDLQRNGQSDITQSTTVANDISPSIYSPVDSVKSPSSRIPLAASAFKKATSPSKTTEDKLDKKISNILTTMPIKIKLAAEPTSPAGDTLMPHTNSQIDVPPRSTSNSFPTSTSKTSSTSTSNSTRSSTPTPSLTLTPAHRSRTSHTSESDVKLYHLHRSGPNQPKDAPPMKLFVRLVGQDGERVMVRVGGGWADLGEYLREYAQHHGGSRRISGNKFEVQNFPTSSPDGTTSLSQTPNNNLSINKTRPSVPPRPSSLLDLFDLGSSNNAPARSSTTAGAYTHRPRRSTTNATLDESPMPSPAMSISTTTTSASTPYSHRQSDASSSAATPSPIAHSLSTTDTGFNLHDPSGLRPQSTYTPLGASGPKSGAKSRASSGSFLNSTSGTNRSRSATPAAQLEDAESDEKWVDEMVGKARRISGGRTVSAAAGTPGYVASGRMASANSLGSALNIAAEEAGSVAPVTIKGGGQGQAVGEGVAAAGGGRGRPRPKSSIGGIRRVFLRRKDKA